MDQYSKKKDSNQLKLYTILFAYSWGIQTSLFGFCRLIAWLSQAFVYNTTDVNKIFAIFFQQNYLHA